MNLNHQTELFWKASHSSKKHFKEFSFHSIPSPSSYMEHILSILEDLGYERRDLIFSKKEIGIKLSRRFPMAHHSSSESIFYPYNPINILNRGNKSKKDLNSNWYN
jgi:hypothetical protein